MTVLQAFSDIVSNDTINSNKKAVPVHCTEHRAKRTLCIQVTGCDNVQLKFKSSGKSIRRPLLFISQGCQDIKSLKLAGYELAR